MASELRKGQWTPAEDKELIRLYSNIKKPLTIKEIAYRLNKKISEAAGTPRNTGATGQRLTALRAAEEVETREVPEGVVTFCSDEAEAYMAGLDKKKAKPNGKAGKKTGTAAKEKAGIPRSRDVMLDSAQRTMVVDLGEKGKAEVAISGPLLLNDEFVSNIGEALAKAMVI